MSNLYGFENPFRQSNHVERRYHSFGNHRHIYSLRVFVNISNVFQKEFVSVRGIISLLELNFLCFQ